MKLISIIGYVIGYLAGMAVSMFAVCGIIKCITLIFGGTFNWITAICIWALLFAILHIINLKEKMNKANDE